MEIFSLVKYVIACYIWSRIPYKTWSHLPNTMRKHWKSILVIGMGQYNKFRLSIPRTYSTIHEDTRCYWYNLIIDAWRCGWKENIEKFQNVYQNPNIPVKTPILNIINLLTIRFPNHFAPFFCNIGQWHIYWT